MAQITNKQYRCRNCDHVQTISTNHFGSCFDYCHECSWKMGWRKSGIYGVADGLDVPMFGHMYRPFDCVEQEVAA